MKLWIDDLKRPPSDGTFWVWAKTTKQALEAIRTMKIDHISFDHDLGENEDGSIDEAIVVAKFIEEKSSEGKFGRIRWDVHSENPVGRDNIMAAMTSAERFWKS